MFGRCKKLKDDLEKKDMELKSTRSNAAVNPLCTFITQPRSSRYLTHDLEAWYKKLEDDLAKKDVEARLRLGNGSRIGNLGRIWSARKAPAYVSANHTSSLASPYVDITLYKHFAVEASHMRRLLERTLQACTLRPRRRIHQPSAKSQVSLLFSVFETDISAR
jgi:hypothetical protein